METEGRLRVKDVFVGIRDPRQAKKVEHDLIELLVVAVCGVLAGADDFVEIEAWANEKCDWFRKYLCLEHGIPSHDTFGRVFAAIDAEAFGAAFRRWVSSIVPNLEKDEVVAIDGKTSRRTGKVNATPLHLVSAFAASAGLVLGQRATAAKSNEKTAIPELLATLALEGALMGAVHCCKAVWPQMQAQEYGRIVMTTSSTGLYGNFGQSNYGAAKLAQVGLMQTLALEGATVPIDAMGTQPNIAQAIRDRGAEYILSVKDNQPTLADSVQDFFATFQAAPEKTPHHFEEIVEKDHGRIEVRRCYAFDQIDCLHAPERWPDLKSFAVIASERTIKGKTTLEHRFYISSLPADAGRINRAVRHHWRVENSLHWCLDVAFGDDQMRARTGNAAHNFAVMRHFALNLIRLDPIKRKGGLKVRRLIAATSDAYRAELLGLI